MNTKESKKEHSSLEEEKISCYFLNEINSIIKLIDSYPFEKKQAYGYFLNQQYFLIRYSSRLLALAASQIETSNPKEFLWWTSHLKEEIGHDQLILNDMVTINYKFNETVEPVIRGLSLALFQDVQSYGYDTLLGYALMLEGLSTKRCSLLAERIKKTYGGGFTYLKVHAISDDKHFPQGMERIATFSAHRQQLILDNLHMSACLYRHFLSIISRKFC